MATQVEKVVTSMLRVDLSEDGPVVRLKPAGGHLGDELWASYLSATSGAKYDRSRNSRVVTLDKVPGVLVRLRDAGFDAALSTELRAKLAATTILQWQDYHGARDRLAAIDKQIFEAHGERLFPYQYTGAVWLTLRQGGAALFDEQGVGKTRSILVSLPPNAPVLVVCPASVKSVWYGETEKIRPQLRPRVLEGRASFRWPKAGEMLIANYEILPEVHDVKGARDGGRGRVCEGFLPPEPCPGCKDELVTFPEVKMVRGHKSSCNGLLDPFPCAGCAPFLDEMVPGTVLVVDEAQAVKNSRAERSVRVRAISAKTREVSGKSMVMTGTPLENDPGELWSVLQAAGLAQEAFGDWATFVELFKGRKTEHNGRSFGYSWEEDPSDQVVERLRRVSLRRTKADVQSDLPPKLYSDRLVPIDRKVLEQCEFFLKEHGGVNGVEALLAEEVKFERMSAILSALAAAKVSALLKIVEEEFESKGEPVLVFAMHRMPVELLGKKKGWATILGGEKHRGEIVQQFQAGKLKGLACTIQAAGTGLTLHRAASSIFLSRSFNPMQNVQAEDRIHRIGQKRTVQIISIVGDHPLDRRIAEITAKKIRMFNASIGASSVVTNDGVEAGQTQADREFESYLKRIDDEVKGRPLPRQFARTEPEREVVTVLEHGRFARRSDDRLACELLEEANAIGLSEPRWRLALKLAERREPEDEPTGDSLPPETAVSGLQGGALEGGTDGDQDQPDECADYAASEGDLCVSHRGLSQPEVAPIRGDRLGDGGDALARRAERREVRLPVGGEAGAADAALLGLISSDGLVQVAGDPHLPDCGAVIDLHHPCTCGSVPFEQTLRTELKRGLEAIEREDEDADDDDEEPMNELTKKTIADVVRLVGTMKPTHRIETVMQIIDAMSDEERESLFEQQTDEYHILCGKAWPEGEDDDHDCPYPDEEEGEGDEGDGAPESGPDVKVAAKTRTRSL